MITIQDLIEQLEIQGAYKVVAYNEEIDKAMIVAEGYDIKPYKIEDKYLTRQCAHWLGMTWFFDSLRGCCKM